MRADGKQEALLHKGKAENYADFLMMMSYDQGGGHHSTLEFGKRAVGLGISAGLPPAKLLMGVPFYGRYRCIRCLKWYLQKGHFCT